MECIQISNLEKTSVLTFVVWYLARIHFGIIILFTLWHHYGNENCWEAARLHYVLLALLTCFIQTKVQTIYLKGGHFPENISPRNSSKYVIYKVFVNWLHVKIHVRKVNRFCQIFHHILNFWKSKYCRQLPGNFVCLFFSSFT